MTKLLKYIDKLKPRGKETTKELIHIPRNVGFGYFIILGNFPFYFKGFIKESAFTTSCM